MCEGHWGQRDSILSIPGGEDGVCFLLSVEGVADVESCWCCAGDMSVMGV